jgi:hypothetical protein
MGRNSTLAATWLLASAVLAGCDGTGSSGSPTARQTKFPGQVSSGGATGGTIMAQADAARAPAAPGEQAGGAAAGQEAMRGQAPRGDVSGTPGIPEGAGGTPSGPAMGGTTPAAAATQTPPPASLDPQQAEALKKQQAAAQMEKEKLDLAHAMDRVAARWRGRAEQEGRAAPKPVPAEVLPGSGGQAPAAGKLPIRSEKLGTAPLSPDVKDPAEKGK